MTATGNIVAIITVAARKTQPDVYRYGREVVGTIVSNEYMLQSMELVDYRMNPASSLRWYKSKYKRLGYDAHRGARACTSCASASKMWCE